MKEIVLASSTPSHTMSHQSEICHYLILHVLPTNEAAKAMFSVVSVYLFTGVPCTRLQPHTVQAFGTPRHVQTCSIWTSLYSDHPRDVQN